MRRAAWTVVLLCIGCDSEGVGVQVSGAHPFTRCWAAEPPQAERAGITVEERVITVDTVRRIVMFAGAGDADLREPLEGVHGARPDLVVMVGDLGSSDPGIRRNVEALGRLDVPVVFVAGGADVHPQYERYMASDAITDGSGARIVRAGAVELVPLPGAPGGRYAEGQNACGFTAADVRRIAEAVGPAGEAPRYLVSWAAPTGTPGMDGLDAGSELVSRLAEAVGARGVIHAWPRERAGDSSEAPFRVALRPIAGAWPGLTDGSRARPGFTLFRVGRDGLTVQRSP
jgi:hypothetical protein